MYKGKLVVPTVSVPLPGADEPLVLRGLSVNDLKNLINMHRAVATTLFAKAMDIKGTKSEDAQVNDFLSDLEQIALMVIDETPHVLSDTIALAAGDIENSEAYLDLPFQVQFEAIGAVMKLTFGEDEVLKKLLAAVTKLIAGINQTVAQN